MLKVHPIRAGFKFARVQHFLASCLILTLLSPLKLRSAAASNFESNEVRSDITNQDTGVGLNAYQQQYQQYLATYRDYEKRLKQRQAIYGVVWLALIAILAIVLWSAFRRQKRFAERTIQIHEANYELLAEIRDIL